MSKITKEVKIGVAFVIALFLLYFGISFLKGINIFTPSNSYTVVFDDVAGLLIADAVTVNGLKVGQVFDMNINPEDPKTVLVHIRMDKGMKIPVGSKILLEPGMISSAALLLEPKFGVTEYYTSDDLIKGEKKSGLMDAAATIIPKVENLLPKLDSILIGVNQLANGEDLKQTLANANALTAELTKSSQQVNTLLATLNKDMPAISKNLVATTDNFETLSNQAKEIDLVSTFNKLDSTMTNIQYLSSKLTSKDGSVGLLLNDTKMYEELNDAIKNASLLMEDLKQNPSKYINVKVF